jgi:hypothetical protein
VIGYWPKKTPLFITKRESYIYMYITECNFSQEEEGEFNMDQETRNINRRKDYSLKLAQNNPMKRRVEGCCFSI